MLPNQLKLNIMAFTSETAYNKNVANFSSAYQILEEMGAIYNPSNSHLLLVNLQPKKVSLGAKITVLNDKKLVYKNAVAENRKSNTKEKKGIT